MTGIDRLADMVRDYARQALISEGMDEDDAEEELAEIVDEAIFLAAEDSLAGLSAEAVFKRLRSWLDVRIDEALLDDGVYGP